MNSSIFRIFAVVLLLAVTRLATAGTVTYVYTDPQGTPLAEANASGTITATFDYKPYGSQALGSPKAGPGYTGHVNDPDTGFVYMQARYYDPVAGRFLSRDPIAKAMKDVFSINDYLYVNGNPIRLVDIDGKQPGETQAKAMEQAKELNHSGGSLRYVVVRSEPGDHGFTIQEADAASREAAGLKDQATVSFQGGTPSQCAATCPAFAAAFALTLGDVSKGDHPVSEAMEKTTSALEKTTELLEKSADPLIQKGARMVSHIPVPLLRAATGGVAYENNYKTCMQECPKTVVQKAEEAEENRHD